MSVTITPTTERVVIEGDTVTVETPSVTVVNTGGVGPTGATGIQGPAGPDGNVQVLARYTELRALTGGVYAHALVRGATTGLGATQGMFAYDAADTTTADNGGTVIVDADGRRWKRLYEGRLNLKWFGAVGDGSTNDTAAWKLAVVALTASGGGTLYLPEGTYLLDPWAQADATALAEMQIPANTTVVGDGPTATIFKINHAVHNADVSANTSWRLIQCLGGCVMRDFAVNGMKSLHTARGAVTTAGRNLTVNGDNCHLERLHSYDNYSSGNIEGWGIGVGLSEHVSVRDCKAYDNLGSGLSVNGQHTSNPSAYVTVDGFEAYGNTWLGVTIFGSHTVHLNNIYSYRNGLLASQGGGINIEFASDVTISNAIAYQNWKQNINVIGYSPNLTLSNVQTWSAGDDAYWVTGSTSPSELRTGGVDFSATGDAGSAQYIALTNCIFTPIAGNPHIDGSSALVGQNQGLSLPTLVFVNCVDANGLRPEQWTYAQAGTLNQQAQNLDIRDKHVIRETEIDLSAATLSGLTRTTEAAPASGGTLRTTANNATVYRFVGTTINQNWRVTLPTQYGLQYLRLRMMPIDDTGTIITGFHTNSDFNHELRWRHKPVDYGTWFDICVISKYPQGVVGTTYQVRQQLAGSNTTTWLVDGNAAVGIIDDWGQG